VPLVPALALFALFLLVPPGAAGQPLAGIRVVVLDATGLPMPGVALVLLGPAGQVTATTAEDGTYTFPVSGQGSYRLIASRPGFRDWAQTVVVDSATTLAVDVSMQPRHAETAIVTAVRGEQSLIMAPASVGVLGSREIAASTADNVADLLREVPGLNIVQFGARDINVNARGSTGILSNSMLVTVDGRSIFQPLYGAVYWDLMTATKDEIRQIEVLRTPASALWGANALRGVINIRTKSPREMDGLGGHLSIGTRGTKSAGSVWADSSDRLSYKISGSYFEQEPWDRDNLLPDGSPMPLGVRFENRGTKQPKFDVRVDWDGDPNRVWSIRGGLAGANGLIHSALGPAEFEAGSYYSYLEIDRRTEQLDFKAYWNRLDAPFRIVLFGLDEDATNDTFVADVTRHARVGTRHQLTYGGSVRLDRFDITIAPVDRTRLDGAAFVQNSITVSPRLNLVVGGRLDKFDTTNAVFAPRVALVLSPSPAHAVRLTYNRAYRAPSLLENFVDVSLPTVVPLDPPFLYFQDSLGSTELEMERNDAVELGYTGVLGSRTTVFATAYHQRVANMMWFLPVSFYGPGVPPPGWPGNPALVPPLPHTFSFINLGSVRDRGLEVATMVEWASFSLGGSYTYQASPRLKSGTSLPLQINRPPTHQAGGSVTYVAGPWRAGADVQYSDRAFWADVLNEPFWGYTGAYVSANARVAYRLRASPWELWLSVSNLFDEKIKGHVYGDTIRRKVATGINWSLR
jgi:iron complex outermembrane receptor protein